MPLYDKNKPKPMNISGIRYQPEYKDVQSDTRYESYRDLTIYLEGSTWIVDLYSRVINEDTENTSYDRSLHASLQNYRHIRGYELKVTQGLQKEYNSEKGKFIVTGAANVYPGFTLNVGDNFIAEIGEGKLGHFNIKEVTPKTIYKERAYSITYQMIDVVDDSYLRDLNKKVVETLVFVRDAVRYGCNPVYALDDYRLRETCINTYHGLSNYYIREFFYNQDSTICLGSSSINIYDPFVVRFFLAIVDSSENPLVKQIRKHIVNTTYDKNILTVFDALLDKDFWKLATADNEMSLISNKIFRNHQPYAGGIAYTKLSKVIYPSRYNPNYHLREGHIEIHRDLGLEKPKLDKPYTPNNYTPDQSLTGNGETCPIFPDYQHPKSVSQELAEYDEKIKNRPTHDENGNYINYVKDKEIELKRKGQFPFTDKYIEYLPTNFKTLLMEDERLTGTTQLGALLNEKNKVNKEESGVSTFINDIPLFNSGSRGKDENKTSNIHVLDEKEKETINPQIKEKEKHVSRILDIGIITEPPIRGNEFSVIRFDYEKSDEFINAVPYNPENPIEGSVYVGEDGRMRVFSTTNLVNKPLVIPERGLVTYVGGEEYDIKKVRICECECCQTGGWGNSHGDNWDDEDDTNDKNFAGFGNLVPYAVPIEFYNDINRTSPELLRLLNLYMRNEKIDYDSVIKIATEVMKTTRRKKFYCIPLIMMLLINVIGDYRFTR